MTVNSLVITRSHCW
ncbi:hypothetical protein Nmel_002997 [Mimus melanotis]